MNLKRLASGSLISAVALLGAPQMAQAIVINDTAGMATAIALGTAFPAVVQLSTGCSGTLISANTVLTAQHCTFGTAATAITVNFDTNNNGVTDTSVGVSAKFELDLTNILLDGTDVAVLTLASAAPAGITPMQLFAGNPTGVLADTIGYGNKGTGTAGFVSGTFNTTKWGAENIIDFYGQALSQTGVAMGGTANIFSTDFDNENGTSNSLELVGSAAAMILNEGTTAPGDSGGPLIVNMFGIDLIVGVLSGGTDALSRYGDVSWWTGTFQWRTQIENLGGVFISQIPLPSTLALLLLGFAALQFHRTRSAASA